MAENVDFSPMRNPANPDRIFIFRIAPKDNTLSYEQRAIHKSISAPRWNKNPGPEFLRRCCSGIRTW